MTDRPELKTVKKLHRNLCDVLAGHPQPIIGTALVMATADWLRQYHRADLTEPQLDQLHIQILMRFLKGVTQELSLGMEVGRLDDDDDLPTLGNA